MSSIGTGQKRVFDDGLTSGQHPDLGFRQQPSNPVAAQPQVTPAHAAATATTVAHGSHPTVVPPLLHPTVVPPLAHPTLVPPPNGVASTSGARDGLDAAMPPRNNLTKAYDRIPTALDVEKARKREERRKKILSTRPPEMIQMMEDEIAAQRSVFEDEENPISRKKRKYVRTR